MKVNDSKDAGKIYLSDLSAESVGGSMKEHTLKSRHLSFQTLKKELETLQKHVDLGYQVKVEWLPASAKYDKGKKLADLAVLERILHIEEPELGLWLD